MEKDKIWYKSAIFYELNVRTFKDSNGDGIGDFRGLISQLPYIKKLGIDCIWLMPIYPSPLRDDGYDISDYYGIHPDLGTIEDFKEVLNTAHQLGLRIIIDLVLNHCSDQHPWFMEARNNPDSSINDYFVWTDNPDKYKEARIIFLDVEESNWTWDEKVKKYFWHRFYSSQPDLNYDNPEVQEEMLNVVRYWLNLGIDGFRVDAVPYLFEREGTNCENLPETHDYLKKLREFVEEINPEALLLCEANQWPEDLLPYFGEGDEFHMGFHFPLMPRIFMAMRKRDVTPIKEILARTPQIPEDCAWCTFLRNHDELTLEMVTEQERQWMWEQYAPEERMRLNLGIRRRLATLLENNPAKILLANSLLFTLPGSPTIYYGDEIGMGDNIWLKDRNGVRTPMQWSDQENAGFSSADPEKIFHPVIDSVEYPLEEVNVQAQINSPDSLLCRLQEMIAVRKNNPALALGEFVWIDEIQDPGIVAFYRKYETQKVIVFHNLTGADKCISQGSFLEGVSCEDLLQKSFEITQDGDLILKPYEFHWFEIS